MDSQNNLHNYSEDEQQKGTQKLNQRKQQANDQQQQIIGKQQNEFMPTPVNTLNNQKAINYKINKEKLIEQNVKLRSQLMDLAIQMDKVLSKQVKKKKAKQAQCETDPGYLQIKKQLKNQENEISKNKTKISNIQKTLQLKFDINKVVDKENQLKVLKKELSSLETQKGVLQKIQKNQDKAANRFYDKQTQKRNQEVKSQKNKLSNENKILQENIRLKQKQIRKLHQSNVSKEERIKYIDLKICKGISKQITVEQIKQIQSKLQSIQQQKIKIQLSQSQILKNLVRQKKQLAIQMQKQTAIFKQKNRQLKLNHIKKKQILRLILSYQNKKSQFSNLIIKRNALKLR